MSKSPESALNTGDKDSSNISAWDSLAINSEARANKSDIISPQEIEVNPNTVTTQITAVAGVMEMYFKNKANKTTSSEIVDKIDNEYLAGEFAFEAGEVLKGPEHVGINLNDIIVDGRINILARGELPDRYQGKLTDAQIVGFKDKQVGLVDKFQQCIDQFNGQLKYARYHRGDEWSPVSIQNAVAKDGTVSFAPEFIEQMKILTDNVEDVTICAELQSDRYGNMRPDEYIGKNGDIFHRPPIGERRQDYINMIDGLLTQIGDDITIELGNECNENIIVNEGTDNESQAGVNINPQEYGEFYRDVVSQLKAKHPTTKFNIAGVSGADINWIRSVIEAVSDDSLIDNFSVHPYRGDVNGAAWGHSETNKTDIPYPIVEQQLIELANMHNIGFQCGEIAYGGGTTPEATELAHYRLDQELKRSAANNVVAYIWPRTGLPF